MRAPVKNPTLLKFAMSTDELPGGAAYFEG